MGKPYFALQVRTDQKGVDANHQPIKNSDILTSQKIVTFNMFSFFIAEVILYTVM